MIRSSCSWHSCDVHSTESSRRTGAACAWCALSVCSERPGISAHSPSASAPGLPQAARNTITRLANPLFEMSMFHDNEAVPFQHAPVPANLTTATPEVFEGPEKKLEVFFGRPASSPRGFRSFDQAVWSDVLTDAKCSILHLPLTSIACCRTYLQHLTNNVDQTS